MVGGCSQLCSIERDELTGCHKHKCSRITLVQQGLVFLADQVLNVLLSTLIEELQMRGRVMLVD